MLSLLFVFHRLLVFYFFFFNDTATTEIYTLSLHDALPIWICSRNSGTTLPAEASTLPKRTVTKRVCVDFWSRSEEHTSELQSQSNLVCRLLLEKKKNKQSEYQKQKDELQGERIDTWICRNI